MVIWQRHRGAAFGSISIGQCDKNTTKGVDMLTKPVRPSRRAQWLKHDVEVVVWLGDSQVLLLQGIGVAASS